jgi:hypothetical protein
VGQWEVIKSPESHKTQDGMGYRLSLLLILALVILSLKPPSFMKAFSKAVNCLRNN